MKSMQFIHAVRPIKHVHESACGAYALHCSHLLTAANLLGRVHSRSRCHHAKLFCSSYVLTCCKASRRAVRSISAGVFPESTFHIPLSGTGPLHFKHEALHSLRMQHPAWPYGAQMQVHNQGTQAGAAESESRRMHPPAPGRSVWAAGCLAAAAPGCLAGWLVAGSQHGSGNSLLEPGTYGPCVAELQDNSGRTRTAPAAGQA